MDDRFSLDRFVQAQENGGAYARAVAELRAGAKQSHWMWFVFPQLAGLGHSEMSRRFAIASVEEARAYLAHPLLGTRLVECARIVSESGGLSPREMLGETDARKLRSSMTLFARAAPQQPVFAQALAVCFDGVSDTATQKLLDEPPAA
jgi:uncharacterized protein (DUF1810 family)